MGKIKIVGLGPGKFSLLTLESRDMIRTAKTLLLRTAVHPTVAELKKRGVNFFAYDSFYERAKDFRSLYRDIADDVIRRATGGDVVYAVTGSPLVAEATVAILREKAARGEADVEIFPAMSFLDVLYAKVGFDPIDGVTIIDAADLGNLAAAFAGRREFCPALVVTQVYDRRTASDAKLSLMEIFPDEYEIIFLRNLALDDEEAIRIPLFELDRRDKLDHLTSVFVPACKRETIR